LGKLRFVNYWESRSFQPEDALHDLKNFTDVDAEECAAAFRKAASQCTSMEDVAKEVVSYLYESLIDPVWKRKSCALVRLYKTHDYGELTPDLQRFADGVLGHKAESKQMKCLTLLATVGDKPEWNSREHSRGHKSIPLPTVDFVSKIPMIARLINQFGLDINAVVRPDPNLLADLERRTYNAFHVAEAVGSPYIPAQKEFVLAYKVRSVLGFGGMLGGPGDLYAVILFSKVTIEHKTCELFSPVGLDLKLSLQPFVRNVFAAAA
jgi:hypothetical protein